MSALSGNTDSDRTGAIYSYPAQSILSPDLVQSRAEIKLDTQGATDGVVGVGVGVGVGRSA